MRMPHWVIVAIAIFGVGITGAFGGFYLALWIQGEFAALLAGSVIFGVLAWLGSATDIMGLLREWYKDKASEQRRASLESNHSIWKDSSGNYPLLSVDKSQVLTLQVTNSEGGEVAQECGAKIRIKGIIDYDNDALNWLYNRQLKGIFIPGDHTKEEVTAIIQWAYAKNWKENIRAGESSYADILFTRKDGQFIYVLDSDHTKLEYGQVYDVSVTVIANNLKPKQVSFQVEIPSWDDVRISNFSAS